MKPANEPIEVSLTAAEYALGIMQGADRTRFESLLAANPALKASVLKWATVMNGIECQPGERDSPPQIWERIRGRLAIEEQTLSRLRGDDMGLSESLATSIAVLRIVQDRLVALQKKFDGEFTGRAS